MNFFKDKHGKVVMWQRPNLPITAWAVFKLLSLVIDGRTKAGAAAIATAFAFTWAYLEITKGASPFRRTLGAVAMIAILHGFFW